MSDFSALSRPVAMDEIIERAEAERDRHIAAAGKARGQLPMTGSDRPLDVARGVMDICKVIEALTCRMADLESRSPHVHEADAFVPQQKCDGFAVQEAGKHVDVMVERMIKCSAKRSTRRNLDVRSNLSQYLRSVGFKKKSAGVLAVAIRRAYNILHGQVDDSPQTVGYSDCWGPWLVLSDQGMATKAKAWVDWQLLTMAQSGQWCLKHLGQESSLDAGSLFALHFVLSRYDQGLAEELLISLFQQGGKQDLPHRDVLRRAVNRLNDAMRSVPLASKKRRRPTAEMCLFVCALVVRVFFAELQGAKPDLRFDPTRDAFPLVPPCNGVDD